MKPVSVVSGTAVPLPRANVDTDQIIPKQFLKRVERSGFGEFLFFDWTKDREGELDPSFVLNKPEYQDAVVLIAGKNFGSGSSREHAPWALEDWGFQAIIAPSFADIFKSNCSKIGLLTVELSSAEVDTLTLLAEDPQSRITIDLAKQTVSAEGFEATFDIDPFVKHCLLNGLDHIALSLEHRDAIDGFEAARPSYNPVVSFTRQEQAQATPGANV
ncbi:MAG: 3-isopropylmalate dehydratase small subunit [Armatimonadetes bacterium]|nr:MAG: 3-isopropylmalate dehydratase small subunit [Armatimonadota bacterium]